MFVDVGQGDAVLLSDANCQLLLIDGGPSYDVDYAVFRYSYFLQCKNLEGIVLSHFHKDHYFGLKRILQRCPNTKFYATENYLQANQFHALHKGDRLSLFDVSFLVVWPPAGHTASNQNNNSLVLVGKLAGKNTIFLTGDLEVPYFAQLNLSDIQSVAGCCLDIYKAAHHGAANGYDAIFLSNFEIENIVLSVGKNSYGHPNSTALEGYAVMSSKLYRTDVLGDVKFHYQR